MEKHNGIISFWKFAFCIIVIILHAGELYEEHQEVLFRNGSIAVEFFFVVAGYLMCKKACNTKTDSNSSIGKETFQFITNKFVRLLPYILIAFIVDFILRCIAGNGSIEKNTLGLFDFLMLRMAGFKTAGFMGNTWYISAMLITMVLIYPQIKKFDNNYFYLIAPILIKLKKINFTNLAQVILTIIECGGFMLVILSSHFLNYSNLDYIMLLTLAISILLAFSEQTLELSLFKINYSIS